MVDDSQVSRDDFVLQDGPVWNIYSVSMVGDYNNGSFQHDVPTEIDIARHREVIQLQHLQMDRYLHKCMRKTSSLNK